MHSVPRTRVWWDGSEVLFIRWTDSALVFNWGAPRHTAIHMPRGAVVRLVDKGVLQINGYMPEWLWAKLVPLDSPPAPHLHPVPTMPNRRSIVMRLIQKLTGGGELRVPAAVKTGAAAPSGAYHPLPHRGLPAAR
jgi:hypothetical protein